MTQIRIQILLVDLLRFVLETYHVDAFFSLPMLKLRITVKNNKLFVMNLHDYKMSKLVDRRRSSDNIHNITEMIS